MSEQEQMPKVRCVLQLEFDSSESAERVHRSVELDNQGYIATRVRGNLIHAEIEADSLNSLLHTLDDFLACAGVADKIVVKKD
jgi:tRNA threonylcarbamoyladenosine modification (KEOPS) complex  Pcc1 subunit